MKKFAALFSSLALTVASLVTFNAPASAAAANPATITVSDCSLNSPTISSLAIIGDVNDTFNIVNAGTGTCRVYPGAAPAINDAINGSTVAPDSIGTYWQINSGSTRTFKIVTFGTFRLGSNAGSGSAPTLQVALTLDPVPTISADGLVLALTSGSWGANSERLFACQSPNAVPTDPFPQSAYQPMGCQQLFTDSNSGQAYGSTFDLQTALVYAGAAFAAFDPSQHGSHIIVLAEQRTFNYLTASVQVASTATSPTTPTPYTGPILQTPGAVAPVAQGSKVVIPGSNLSGVSKVEIGGMDAKVVVNSAGELEITVPVGLAAGTYDLVVTSDSGRLTVQDGIRVSGSAAVSETNESTARPSTKLKEDNTVKVHVFNVVGAGKVQIMFNGREIAWVNTADPDDSKLLNEYLVRTLELVDGKNVIEIFVDGKRVDRKAYTK